MDSLIGRIEDRIEIAKMKGIEPKAVYLSYRQIHQLKGEIEVFHGDGEDSPGSDSVLGLPIITHQDQIIFLL